MRQALRIIGLLVLLSLVGCEDHSKDEFVQDAGAMLDVHSRIIAAETQAFLNGEVDGYLKMVDLAMLKFKGAHQDKPEGDPLESVATYNALENDASSYITLVEAQVGGTQNVDQKKVDKLLKAYKADYQAAKDHLDKVKAP